MIAFQKKIRLKPQSRGFHIITNELLSSLKEISEIQIGTAHLHIQHTSAGLTVNENADPTVREDFETFFTRLVPEIEADYKHVFEGLDDMTSHIKSSLIGSSVTVPIRDGEFNLGVWQGIYLCEFRNQVKTRSLIVTVMGTKK